MSAFFLLSGAALFLDLVVEDKSTLKVTNSDVMSTGFDK